MKPYHINAEIGDISDSVLLPGDPLRAKYIAEKYLTNIRLVNTVRNMLAYTGEYKGHKITVMGSGMGIPSVAIYAYELYHFYKVNKIIRIGTGGSWSRNVHIRDIILGLNAYSDSNFAYAYRQIKEKQVDGSGALNQQIYSASQEVGVPILPGTIYTSEVFDVHQRIDHLVQQLPEAVKPLTCEMEAFGLFHIAQHCGKEAACLISIVDSIYEESINLTPEERAQTLDPMIILALESIIK